VYLLSTPPPAVTWQAPWVRWPDFGLPADHAHAQEAPAEAGERAGTERGEIACRGGRGRTGNPPARPRVIDGLPATQAVALVRQHYHPHAVQTPWQKRYISRFGAPRHQG